MSDIVNFEIKCRVPCCSSVEKFLINSNAISKGIDHQVDTYFSVPEGRLKLRQGNVENSLIFYKRDNTAAARESEIYLEKIEEDSTLPDLLLRALTKKVIVDKKRKIFFIDNVKFHIDKVAGLGEFIEIEAISISGEHSRERLEEQCNLYIKGLSLLEKDYMNLSYSDLINEEFSMRLKRELNHFSELFMRDVPSFIQERLNSVDHLCYRASTSEEYEKLKKLFNSLGAILVSAPVGGREITTFKLKNGLSFCGQTVEVLELAHPKLNNKYSTGFEHVEIVIPETFQEFTMKNSTFKFDFSGAEKSINPELRYEFPTGISVKFHHQTLESVIEYEKKHKT